MERNTQNRTPSTTNPPHDTQRRRTRVPGEARPVLATSLAGAPEDPVDESDLPTLGTADDSDHRRRSATPAPRPRARLVDNIRVDASPPAFLSRHR